MGFSNDSKGKLHIDFMDKKWIKREFILIMFFFSFFALGAVFHIVRINRALYESAYDTMEQMMNQASYAVESTWMVDAQNLKELSYVLANTDNKDTVMQNIESNDIVLRYLFASADKTQEIASDGTNLQRNDGHIFLEIDPNIGVQMSETFQSKSGSLSYLLRCPVELNGETYGWIYAQYLFDRVHSMFPDKIYNGNGNFFIIDKDTNQIVFQHDEETYNSVSGKNLDDFIFDVLGGSKENYNDLRGALLNNDNVMIVDTMNGIKTVIYITPILDGKYYVMGVAKDTAVMKGAKTVNITITFSLFMAGFLLLCFILVVTLYRIREKTREELEKNREEHERMLQGALDAVNNANNAKSNFLTNMSHEIRTPINAVLGMNEMVLRHSNEPEVIGYARDVDTAAKSLLQIVNDILDIIRLETGSIEIVSEEYDLEQLFRSVKSMALVKAQKKNLSIVFDFDNHLPKRLKGDFVRVKQIIMNLASNAIKYTNEGSVTISIHGSVLPGRVELQVAVEDTGIGIKAEDIPKLKEKFQRIEETKNRSVEGVGLGLSIASQLLYMMESDLKIESEFGKGSRFSFKLWQDVVDSTAVCESALPVRNIKRSECSFKAPSAQILAVDDNEMNLKVTSKLLEPALMQIDTAKSGAEALILAGEKRYDIILMDHMMPEMDGIETFKRIKENSEFNKATPVIVLTANAILGAREQYLKAGFSDYLSKPVIPKELEDMIKKYLPDNKIES